MTVVKLEQERKMISRVLGRRETDKELAATALEIYRGLKKLGHPCVHEGCQEVACRWTRRLEKVLTKIGLVKGEEPGG